MTAMNGPMLVGMIWTSHADMASTTPWADAPVPGQLKALTRPDASEADAIELVVGGSVLVANACKALHRSEDLGWVVMLRDRTELQQLTRQLDAVGTMSTAMLAPYWWRPPPPGPVAGRGWAWPSPGSWRGAAAGTSACWSRGQRPGQGPGHLRGPRIWLERTMMPEDFRVLIVDDDFHVAKLHAAYVDSVAGFLALAPVGSASLALQAIHSLRPDLVLLDVYLPDASGLDLLQQLDVDTMILRAASDTGSLRKAFRRGALGYLLKPFTAESLSQQLR
ncbi:UNVERIFIED_ORG: CheY-like chemotaxis protein [Arthrobacter sp. UYEF1]